MTERIAYSKYAKLKDNTIITMKICPSVQDSTRPRSIVHIFIQQACHPFVLSSFFLQRANILKLIVNISSSRRGKGKDYCHACRSEVYKPAIIIIIKIVLMVQHTYTHTKMKEIKRKYKAMTTEQITDKPTQCK